MESKAFCHKSRENETQGQRALWKQTAGPVYLNRYRGGELTSVWLTVGGARMSFYYFAQKENVFVSESTLKPSKHMALLYIAYFQREYM